MVAAGSAEVIDVELLRMRVEAQALRYAALASEHEQVVRRIRRVLELLDPQGLLVPALQPPGQSGNGVLDSLDLLILRLESLADPAGLLRSEPVASPPGDPVSTSGLTGALGDAHRQLIEAVGKGQLLLSEIAEGMSVPRARVHELAAQLQRMGLLERSDIEIPLGPAARQTGIAGRLGLVRLTDAGKQVYRSVFGQEPADLWSDLLAKYKSLQAAFFIRGVADIIRGLNSVEERSFDFHVVDPAAAGDEEIAAVGGQREYRSGDVAVRPDLLVLMRPRKGGADLLVAVEVEFGNYSADRLRDKWRRAMICYPVPFYVVAPSAQVRDRLFREIEETRRQMLASGYIFDRWVRYVFYTADEIARNGLLSPGQIVRFDTARRSGADVTGIPPLPKYFFQKPSRDGDE